MNREAIVITPQAVARLELVAHLGKKHGSDGRTGLETLLSMKPANATDQWLPAVLDQLLDAHAAATTSKR